MTQKKQKFFKTSQETKLFQRAQKNDISKYKNSNKKKLQRKKKECLYPSLKEIFCSLCAAVCLDFNSPPNS